MVTATRAPPAVEVMVGPQTEFFESRAKHPALFAGRRAGKTAVAIIKMFAYMFEHPGARGLITSPIFPQIRQNIIPTIRKFFGSLEGKEWEWKVGTMEIQFLGEYKDSIIYLRPATEPDSFRGIELAVWYMDEISSEHQHEAFLVLKPALTQEGYPHQGWVTSTPDWRKPWVRKIWVEHKHPTTGEDIRASEYAIFRADTKDNWHLPPDIMEDLREAYGDTRWAAQELRGEFIIVEGAGFPEFNERVHVRPLPEGITWRRRVVGIDFGAASPTAMVEVGLDQNNWLWAIREFYKRNCSDHEWVATLGEWGATRVVCDPSTSDKEIRDLRSTYGVSLRRARPAIKGFKARWRLMETRLQVRDLDQPGMFITPDCPNLANEIPNLALHKPRGQEIYEDSWEQGTADHSYDAFCYGAHELDGRHGAPPNIPVNIWGWGPKGQR